MKKRLLLAAGTILQSRYRIVRQLGSGGMGAVYEAVDERISKTVAVKETFADDDDLRKAFEREAKLLARIEHRAFPQVTDYFADGDGYYLVMDLIRGEDFSEILVNRIEPFEPEQICAWADEILDALETLHAQNIIHRDIKPSNLKLTPDGRIKLLDFGIAKGTTGDTTARTISSMAAATLQFAPLEQVLRASADWYFALSVNHADKANEVLQKGTDERSDLYALGATLYEMLTKRLPENAPTRALALWSGQPDKLIPAHKANPQVSKELSAVLQKAMELDAQNRPTSAGEIRKMLREVGKEKEEKIIVADKDRTISLPPTQPVIQNLKPQAVKTEILDNKTPVDFHKTDEKLGQETITLVSLPKVSSDNQKTFIWVSSGVIAIILLVTVGWLFQTLLTANNTTSHTSTSQGKTHTATLPGGVKMEMIEVPSGSFMMGSDKIGEKPIHEVTISKGFQMCRTEVTQAQWQAVMGYNPSYFICWQCPVEQVSWDDVQVFISKLNAQNEGFKYRLPTEAEWEYAARAGTTGNYAGDLNSMAWFIANSNGRTHPVGQKMPNTWGLYDMHGNVWEWVQDWYGDYSDNVKEINPTGATSGSYRVYRGGCWNATAGGLRLAIRNEATPSSSGYYLGFRLLRQ